MEEAEKIALVLFGLFMAVDKYLTKRKAKADEEQKKEVASALQLLDAKIEEMRK